MLNRDENIRDKKQYVIIICESSIIAITRHICIYRFTIFKLRNSPENYRNIFKRRSFKIQHTKETVDERSS